LIITGREKSTPMFAIIVTKSALKDLDFLRKSEERAVVAAIEEQLVHEPLSETRNRKPLRPNDLSAWELRVGDFRVFYDVDAESQKVLVEAEQTAHATAAQVYRWRWKNESLFRVYQRMLKKGEAAKPPRCIAGVGAWRSRGLAAGVAIAVGLGGVDRPARRQDRADHGQLAPRVVVSAQRHGSAGAFAGTASVRAVSAAVGGGALPRASSSSQRESSPRLAATKTPSAAETPKTPGAG